MYGTRYPRHRDEFADLPALVQRYVTEGCGPDQPIIGPEDTVVTMGSCFAINVGKSLAQRGLKVVVNRLHEEANSPFANLLLLDYLVRGEQSVCPHVFAPHIALERAEAILAPLRQARCLIFTVGVGICPFDRRTGDLVLQPNGRDIRDLDWRFPSPAEHAEHLTHILVLLRELNPDLHIVLTLSPVPLYRAITTSSPFVEDCVSKSGLRVAVHEVVNGGHEGVYYWPSFEVFRWVGSHTGPMYGEDDDLPRHVNSAVVDVVTGLFADRFTTLPAQEGEGLAPEILDLVGDA